MMNFSASDSYLRQLTDNLDFEQGMIRIASVTGADVDKVTEHFKTWVRTTPFPWRFAMGSCVEWAVQGKRLPFDVTPVKYF